MKTKYSFVLIIVVAFCTSCSAVEYNYKESCDGTTLVVEEKQKIVPVASREEFVNHEKCVERVDKEIKETGDV